MGSVKHSDASAWILAIDPGKSGGLVKLWEDKSVESRSMPKTETTIAAFFSELDDDCQRIYLEKVWSMPGDGKRQATNFMKHFGFLRGCIFSRFGERTDEILREIPAAVWQRKLGLPQTSKDKNKKASQRKTEHKRELKEIAQMMYPELKVTLLTADALLIAKFGETEEGWIDLMC